MCPHAQNADPYDPLNIGSEREPGQGSQHVDQIVGAGIQDLLATDRGDDFRARSQGAFPGRGHFDLYVEQLLERERREVVVGSPRVQGASARPKGAAQIVAATSHSVPIFLVGGKLSCIAGSHRSSEEQAFSPNDLLEIRVGLPRLVAGAAEGEGAYVVGFGRIA